MNMNDRPEWLDPGKLRWAWWAWEPDYAYRRQGHPMAGVIGNARWLPRWYDRIHAEETVEMMAAAGVNLAVTHFFKGFGLEYEQEGMARTKELVARCHRNGIRVIGYTQFGTLYHEQFFQEVPEAEKWLELDEQGKPRAWSGLYYRSRACCRHREFIDYLKRCISHGLTETGLDGIHFDNSYSMPCYCENCRREFGEFLKRQPEPRERFGLGSFAKIGLPPEAKLEGSIYDPLVQEWIRFRIEGLNGALGELRKHIRQCNPEAAIIANPCLPRGETNLAALRGVEPFSYGRTVDMIWAENGQFPRAENGCVVHQAHAFRLAEAAGYVAVPTTWKHDAEGSGLPKKGADVVLGLAETIAFGGLPGLNWALRARDKGNGFLFDEAILRKPAEHYLQFFRQHEELYAESRPFAQVALLYGASANMFDRPACYPCFFGMEQICVQKKIPYAILSDSDLSRLSEFDLLILPNVSCLGERRAEAITAYVENGGSLLLTGRTGECDDNFREYELNALEALRGHQRVVWLPDTPEKAVNELPAGYSVRVKLPAAAGKLATLMGKLLGKRRLLAVDAPDTVTAELRSSGAGVLCVHLVNYRNERAARGVTVALRPDLVAGREFHYYSPDASDAKTGKVAKPVKRGNSYRFALPPLKTYGILALTE
jgi:hypothetical protein